MKTILKPLLLLCVIAGISFSFCKKDTTTPKKTSNNLTTLSGTWSVNQWGGVSGNILAFSIDASTAIGTVIQVGTQPFGFAVGDQLLTKITYNASAGTYNATGKYTYGTNNATSGTRAAILTLQNNNSQLTIDYPALNSDFGEIIYIFQKTQ